MRPRRAVRDGVLLEHRSEAAIGIRNTMIDRDIALKLRCSIGASREAAFNQEVDDGYDNR